MTMARKSDKTKQFMNNIKQYIREDSEDSECNERDLGEHTVQHSLIWIKNEWMLSWLKNYWSRKD